MRFRELSREDGWKASSSPEEGVNRVTWQLLGANDGDYPDVADIGNMTTLLCGGVDNTEPVSSTNADVDGGKVKRRLPKVSPFSPEVSVAGITSIFGSGESKPADAIQVLGLDPMQDQFTHYQAYDFVTEYKRRPYFLLANSFINRPSTRYYLPDGTDVTIYYAEEWKRFTTTSLTPTPDTVNATTGGQLRFRTTDGLNGTQFPNQSWVYLQNQVLEMNWFMVPYRYFFRNTTFKPYLTRFVNTVNQNTFMGFDPGQLLFLGATPVPFVPQAINTIKFLGLSLVQSQSQLCNIKLRWLATTREGTAVPASPDAGLDNKNNIAGGHNLQPSFIDRKFHYVTTEDPSDPTNAAKWRALYPSFPHELFFTDPMLTQPGGPI